MPNRIAPFLISEVEKISYGVDKIVTKRWDLGGQSFAKERVGRQFGSISDNKDSLNNFALMIPEQATYFSAASVK